MPWRQRDGWAKVGYEVDRDAYVWTWKKAVTADWTLRCTITQARSRQGAGPQGKWFWSAHMLKGSDGALGLNTDWADVWQGEVLFARDGCLLRMVPGSAPRQIADLNANSFRPLRAPSQGVEIARHRRKRGHPLEGA